MTQGIYGGHVDLRTILSPDTDLVFYKAGTWTWLHATLMSWSRPCGWEQVSFVKSLLSILNTFLP